MSRTIKAWHFLGPTLRGGSPIPPDGEWISVVPPIVLCRRGLHGSQRPLDALQYAPGSTICRTEHRGEILYGDDKLCSQERRIIWRVAGEELLRKFGRLCALDVISHWDAPAVVVRYLRTGDDAPRAAAWSAARAAASDAQNRRLVRMIHAAHREAIS